MPDGRMAAEDPCIDMCGVAELVLPWRASILVSMDSRKRLHPFYQHDGSSDMDGLTNGQAVAGLASAQ